MIIASHFSVLIIGIAVGMYMNIWKNGKYKARVPKKESVMEL